MFSKTFNVLLALALVGSVAAQESVSGSVTAAAPQTTAGISPCILACSVASAQANECSSVVDFPCVCGSAQFQVDAAACLEANCTAEEVTAALGLQESQCGNLSISASGTAGPAKTLSVNVSRPSGSASSASAAPSAEPSETADDEDGGARSNGAGIAMVLAGVVAGMVL